MTPQQADWLRSHKNYRAMHQAGGNTFFDKPGILHADGTFELREAGKNPRVTQGCFEVGILTVRQPAGQR